MGNNTITIILVLGYFVLCILLAMGFEYMAKRRHANETSEAYSTAKNSLGVLAVFGLMIGNVLGAGYVVGTPGGVIAGGLGYLWPMLGYIIGWTLTLAYIPFYRAAATKYGAASLGEVFRGFFGPRVQTVVSLMIFIAFAGSLSASMVAIAGILRSMLGIGNAASYIIVIAAITFISMMGGMGGLARLNTVHVLVLGVSVLALAVACLSSVGGNFGDMMNTLGAAGHFKLVGGSASTSYIWGILLVQPFVCVVSALSIAGTMGAKNVGIAKRAQSLLVVFAIFFFLCLTIVGTCGKYLWGLEGDNTALYTIAANYGPVMSALASIGVLAAGLSSAPSMVLMMSSIGVREFYQPMVKKPLSDKEKIRMTRIFAILCSVLFQLLGLFSSDLIRIISNAFTVWAACGMVLTVTLLWKRPNEKAVFWSMLVGTILCAIWIFASFFVEGSPLGISIQYITGISTLVTLVVVTLATTKPGPSENYLLYKSARTELKPVAAQAEITPEG